MATESLLSVEGLSVDYLMKAGRLRAVHQVSFDLRAGEAHGIVGQSGSGKSTAVRALMGLLPSSAAVTGTAVVAGRELVAMRGRELRHLRRDFFGFVPQNPFGALNPVYRMRRIFRDALRFRRQPRETIDEIATASLLAVGLDDVDRILSSFAHELSGGMAQRVVIAINVAMQADVIVADEPTTALDLTVQKQILDLLHDITQGEGRGLILVSHDLAVIANYCDSVSVMYGGKVVEQGPVEEVFTKPSHPYTAHLIAASTLTGTEAPYANPAVVGANSELCDYRASCPFAKPLCDAAPAVLRTVGSGQKSRCLRVGNR